MKQILYFSIGAAVGAVSAWFVTKKYYEKRFAEDIDAIRGDYEEEYTKERIEDKIKDLGYISDDPDVVHMEFSKINPVNEENYNEDGTAKDPTEVNPFPNEPVDHPYTIGPDQYHDEMLFDKMTLTYYEGNDALISDEDESLEIGDFIGRDSLDKFGEYESDTVFVRNEKMGMDFEVVLVHGSYED